MANVFSSKALEANLNQTRETNTEIPEIQQWFGELSKEYWGIHKRTQEFLIELNHKYRNNRYVIESLQTICLGDIWLYQDLAESEKAFTVLVEMIRSVLRSKLKDNQRALLSQVLIRFMDRLASLDDFPKAIIFLCIDVLKEDMAEHELLYVKNSGVFKIYLNKVAADPEFTKTLEVITADLLDQCIDYWEQTSQADAWFDSRKKLFPHMKTEDIQDIGHAYFEDLRAQRQQATDWAELQQQPFFNDIANYFRSFSEKFPTHLETIYYLYYLLHLPGMATLNDHLIYDINRNLRNIFDELDSQDITEFLNTIMAEFQELNVEHGGTVLDCILTLGKEIIATGDAANIDYFTKALINLGFNYPGKLSLNVDWQILIDSNHVKNIRVWLELIEENPRAMRELLAALIVNLKLGGIFISDTDLFQRDITKLLNGEITPVYREIKQLARIFPVYFREIGAEGELRDVTTAIDEASRRKDRLIHFMRKQIHIESNNTHIELARKIITYWYDGNKEPLKEMIPQEIYEGLDQDSKWFTRPHETMIRLCEALQTSPVGLLRLDLDVIREVLHSFGPDQTLDIKRIIYIFRAYFLLLEKYSFEFDDVLAMLRGYSPNLTGDLSELKRSLKNDDKEAAIRQIYQHMNHLKAIILDPQPSEASENIYYKRHIAADIPSMYGEYVEPKFDALGLMYRLERTVAKLMTQVTQPFNAEYITAKTFRQIYHILLLFKDGLELDGIYNQGLNSHLDMLKFGLASPSFSIHQYINIFQFMANDIKQIISEYFFDLFEVPMRVIIPQVLAAKQVEMAGDSRKFYHIESEKFLRDNLSTAFLVQDLDNFITDTISGLRSMMKNYSSSFIESMMTYDPDITFSLLTESTAAIDNPVFLGAKAYFLKKLISYGFHVPPGFVITTEVFRHKETIEGHPDMMRDMDLLIEKHIAFIEAITGQYYGKADNPLFFSIRSGSSISLPGAMKTFLNVGMNDEIAEAYSKREGYGWTAWDCYRRFLQSWGMAFGIDRDVFDRVMLEYKQQWDVDLKINFSPDQMKTIACSYKMVLNDYGIEIEMDPFQQLKQAIRSVLDSWFSESAVYYRDHLQIAEDWGTAVVVQKMVLGNRSSRSGTGVIFTSSPFNGCAGINLYGDFALCSQGEDVVSGLVNTLPISELQRKRDYRDSSLSLESGFPKIYQALIHYAGRLIEEYGFVHQEIEFTFESDNPEDLYILQTRNQNLKKQTSFSSFLPAPHEMELVGHGIGMSSAVLSGLLAFDMADMEGLKRNCPEAKIILVRPDTVPDDIPLIFVCDGLITAKGGVTSHAAVAAASVGKVCIVKCKGLVVNDATKECTINGHRFKSGDPISIDGGLGNVYKGNYEIGEI
ncbi:MAG: PEP/pyruvate-binding domain-containing protein [Acetobacterium sp.]|uniref:PEP/pyruvate-binding domain-containing protein n=1 Tax=Acetobacterium sp. TaxID=1872094 RepID=UPI003241BB78